MKHFFIFVFVFGLLGCKTSVQNSNPGDVDEAINYLDKILSTDEKKDFKNLPEKEAVTSLHFETGLWIRNNWILGNRDTNLVNYFHKLGVYHPDDISSLILTSFHRKLNNRSIDLNGQVEYYKSYWAPILECEQKERKLALENYNHFMIGSMINIRMQVDTLNGQRNAVLLGCPNNEWVFNSNKDLEISGIVKDKYFINDSSNVFFKVMITKMNFENTQILMENTKVGDTKSFILRGLTIY